MPSRYLIAEIPTGQLGLNGSLNESNISPGSLTIANAVSYAEGGFVKEGGSSKYNSTAVSGSVDIVGGFDWHPTDSTQRQIIGADDGRILRATGSATGAFTTMATLTTAPSQVIFVAGGAEKLGNNRQLYIFNGKNSPRLVSGDATSLATMSAPAADWSDTASGAPVFGVLHNDRLWVGGNQNDPHRMYYSTASDHDEFVASDAGTFPIFSGEGEKLVAAASFKGQLYCWKFPRGIYYIDSRDPTVANWRVDRISNSIGMAGPQAYAIIDSDIIFMDSSGQFHVISNITEESRITSNISKTAFMGQWVRDNVNMSELHKAKMVYYPDKREVHCAIAGKGSTVNNLRIVLDFNIPDIVRFRTSDKDTVQAIWVKLDADNIDRIATGDADGFVWNLDTDAKTKDGTGYEGKVRTPYMDLSHLDPNFGTIQKNLKWLEMAVNPVGNFDVNVTIYIDGEKSETVTFNMGTGGAALGSFVLNTDVLGGDTVLNKKRRISGAGRRFSFEISNSGNNEDFNISRLYLHFTPGSTRL